MADDDPFGSLDDGIPFGSQAEHPTDIPRVQKLKKPKKLKVLDASSSSWVSKKSIWALIRVALVLGFFFYRFVVS